MVEPARTSPGWRHKCRTIWRQVRRFVLDEGLAAGAIELAGLGVSELEWDDARNGSKNLNAAPSGRRPHARIDPRALCFAHATPQRPSTVGGPRAGGAAARLGCDLRQGVLPCGKRRTGPAHAVRQMAMARFL